MNVLVRVFELHKQLDICSIQDKKLIYKCGSAVKRLPVKRLPVKRLPVKRLPVKRLPV